MALTFRDVSVNGGIHRTTGDTESVREKEYINFPPADGMEIKTFGKVGRTIQVSAHFIATSKTDLQDQIDEWVEMKLDAESGDLTTAWLDESENWILDDMQMIQKGFSTSKYFADYIFTFRQLNDESSSGSSGVIG